MHAVKYVLSPAKSAFQPQPTMSKHQCHHDVLSTSTSSVFCQYLEQKCAKLLLPALTYVSISQAEDGVEHYSIGSFDINCVVWRRGSGMI